MVPPSATASGELLAKGKPHFTPLRQHLRAVEDAGVVLAKVAGPGILQNLGLAEDPWQSRLALAMRWACRLHDLGKANTYFQQVLRGEADGTTQPVRHELVSGLLCACNQLGLRRPLLAELGDKAEMLLNSVTGAVCAHHLKLDKPWRLAAQALADTAAPSSTTVVLDSPELQSFLPEGALRRRIVLAADALEDGEFSLPELRAEFLKSNREWELRLSERPDWRCFAGALKALLMAADAAGSAQAADGRLLTTWISGALSATLSPGECRAVAAGRTDLDALRPFQRATAEAGASPTIVQAGCGSGKTLAAYLWAERHARGRKLFFCYPTTGTTTEGYRGYLAEAELLADLAHSRAEVDLQAMQTSPDEDDEDSLLRSDSLRSWAPKITACTVDVAAALVRNCRRGLYSSPALLDAAFVFDELHSYDDRLFEAVVLLMDALPGAAFLLLSASVQPSRRDFLRQQFPHAQWIDGPPGWEKLPRYRLRSASREEAEEAARAALQDGKRVLWISNTVARASKLATQAFPSRPLTYHSRFRYTDRAQLHRRVVDGFAADAPMLASTTQVAEMSLDIDANLLITDLAPIPSLIQRLGRLNRRATPESPTEPRNALFVEPPNPLPYAAPELRMAGEWLRCLQPGDVSQADLRREWHRLDQGRPFSLQYGSEWLDTGWISLPGQVRGAGFTIRAILERDAAACREDALEIIRREVPVPPAPSASDIKLGSLPRLRGRPIIPETAFQYSPERGFQWKT